MLEQFEYSVEEWQEKKNDELEGLKKFYKAELSLKEPKKLWDDAAEKHRKAAKRWSLAAIIASIIMLPVGAWVICWLYSAQLPDVPLLSSAFLAVSIITFCLYVVRLFIKLALTNSHLAMAYKQKASMTYFYLSLLTREEGKDPAITDNERALILNSLFAAVDTGLVKPGESKESELLTAFALKKA